MALGEWQATITDENGDVQAETPVEVRKESDGDLATIYEDKDKSTTADNPLDTDSDGYVRFFAEGGERYKISAGESPNIITWRYVSIGSAQSADVTDGATDDTSGRVLRIDDYLDRAGESDDAWTTVTSLDNGWTGTVRYIKRAGWVSITANVDGTSKSDDAVITLPSRYRPDENMYIAGVDNNDGSVTAQVRTSSGELQVYGNFDRIYLIASYPVLP